MRKTLAARPGRRSSRFTRLAERATMAASSSAGPRLASQRAPTISPMAAPPRALIAPVESSPRVIARRWPRKPRARPLPARSSSRPTAKNPSAATSRPQWSREAKVTAERPPLSRRYVTARATSPASSPETMTRPPTTGICLPWKLVLSRAGGGVASSDVHTSAATVSASAATVSARKTMGKTISGLPPSVPAFVPFPVFPQPFPLRFPQHQGGSPVLEQFRGGASSGGFGGRRTATGGPAGGPEVLRRCPGPGGHRPHGCCGRGGGPDRALWLRKVHPLPLHQPPRDDRRRHDPTRRHPAAAGGQGPRQAASRHRHGLPVLQPLRPQDGPRERHPRPHQGARHPEGRGHAAGHGPAGAGGHRDQG